MVRTSIPDSAIVIANDDVLTTAFGNEIVVLNLHDGVYYGLDDAGARIWQLLRTPVSVEALRDTVVAEFDVEPANCERDIRSLITELLEHGLVKVREGP